jgi:hypothetical protein
MAESSEHSLLQVRGARPPPAKKQASANTATKEQREPSYAAADSTRQIPEICYILDLLSA